MATSDLSHPDLAAPDLAPVDLRPPDLGPRDFTLAPDLSPREIEALVLLADVWKQPDPNHQIHHLAPLVRFAFADVPHDYDDRSPNGCYADHWDSTAKPPKVPADLNGGEIVMNGYQGGTLDGDGGMPAPAEIHCALLNGAYGCGYGPLLNGKPGPDVSLLLYPPNVHPTLSTGPPLHFSGAGGPAEIGSFDTQKTLGEPNSSVQFATTKDDVANLVFTPTADVVVKYECLFQGCQSVIMVRVEASQDPKDQFDPDTPRRGSITCIDFITGSTTIKKQAIAAMLGCDQNGAGCDATLKSVRTMLMHIHALSTQSDSKGNIIQTRVALGRFGIANLP